jgi:hypothetical protein
MSDLLYEQDSFGANPGTKQLARHIYTRMYCGPIVIVAANPTALLSALRKQWVKLAHHVQKQRASTLQAARIAELNQAIIRMQTMRFATTWLAATLPANIHIVTVEQLLQHQPICQTLYLTSPTAAEQRGLITNSLPQNALVVICQLAR